MKTIAFFLTLLLVALVGIFYSLIGIIHPSFYNLEAFPFNFAFFFFFDVFILSLVVAFFSYYIVRQRNQFYHKSNFTTTLSYAIINNSEITFHIQPIEHTNSMLTSERLALGYTYAFLSDEDANIAKTKALANYMRNEKILIINGIPYHEYTKLSN
jgi:hypothetical protein